MKIKKNILLIFLCIWFAAWCSAESNGECGFQILKVGISASLTGKGEAASAADGDATILWYNPAAVQLCKKSNFCFSHNSYIFENNIENGSLIVRKGSYTYGFGATFLNYGRIDIYDGNPIDIHEKIGEYHPTDILVAANFAFRMLPSLFCGTNLKIIHEKIHTESSIGFSADFGLIYDFFIKGLNFAFVTQNIGLSTKMKNEKIKLPFTCKFGTNYNLNLTNQSELSLSTDLIKYIDYDGIKINFGLEYAFAEVISTRLGYKMNYDEEDFSTGLGLKLNNYNFDYSFVPYRNELGSVHRFSVSYNF